MNVPRAENPDLAALAAQVVRAMPVLDGHERRLAVELYRLLAEAEPVPVERLAGRIALPAGRVDEILAGWPGVYRNEHGNVIGFWGLAQQEMPPHRLLVEGRELWTWCAWDSLFVPVVLGRRARVESVCATTGLPVSATVTPTGVAEPSPAAAVISFLRPEREFRHDVILSFCHHVLFFSSEEAGRQWAAPRSDALLLTLAEGFELGRLVVEAKFGQERDASRKVA